MLPKANRFQFKGHFPKQTLNSNLFSIKYDKNEDGLKVAVVVSKKVDKRAVERNRIKRVILEEVRKTLSKELPYTIIFYARAEASGSENLASEVADSLKNIKWTQ